MNIEHLAENIRWVRARVARAAGRVDRDPSSVQIVAITKTVPPEAIVQAHAAGLRDFGENRIQEAAEKLRLLPPLQPAPTWHLVGHLQTNKVKTALTLFAIIHSVDSVRLAETISRFAPRPVPVLLEVNVAGEASKHGFSLRDSAGAIGEAEELRQAFDIIQKLPMVEVVGLMTVAPLVGDPEEVRPIFSRLRAERDALGVHHLSMGMTDDFEVAVEEGATMLRVGRAIFGERQN